MSSDEFQWVLLTDFFHFQFYLRHTGSVMSMSNTKMSKVIRKTHDALFFVSRRRRQLWLRRQHHRRCCSPVRVITCGPSWMRMHSVVSSGSNHRTWTRPACRQYALIVVVISCFLFHRRLVRRRRVHFTVSRSFSLFIRCRVFFPLLFLVVCFFYNFVIVTFSPFPLSLSVCILPAVFVSFIMSICCLVSYSISFCSFIFNITISILFSCLTLFTLDVAWHTQTKDHGQNHSEFSSFQLNFYFSWVQFFLV